MNEREEFEKWCDISLSKYEYDKFASAAWLCWQAARAPLLDEIARLREIEELYNSGIQVWNPVYESILNERDRLCAQVERLEARNTELRSANGFAELESKLDEFKTKCALLAASWKKAEDRVAELEGTVRAMVEWLEADEPSVFRRGLWDAISAAKPKTSR
jgi:chromosome segregation ATPase